MAARDEERVLTEIRGQEVTFLTLLERRQRVQTLTRFTVPLISARTCCRLGSQRRLVCRNEWETLNPTFGVFSQMAHLTDMIDLLV
jgi:hypothetical protein